MSGSKSKYRLNDPGNAFLLIRRLLVEQAAAQWPRYLQAFCFMLVAAGATGLGAYLIKYVIDAA